MSVFGNVIRRADMGEVRSEDDAILYGDPEVGMTDDKDCFHFEDNFENGTVKLYTTIGSCNGQPFALLQTNMAIVEKGFLTIYTDILGNERGYSVHPGLNAYSASYNHFRFDRCKENPGGHKWTLGEIRKDTLGLFEQILKQNPTRTFKEKITNECIQESNLPSGR